MSNQAAREFNSSLSRYTISRFNFNLIVFDEAILLFKPNPYRGPTRIVKLLNRGLYIYIGYLL